MSSLRVNKSTTVRSPVSALRRVAIRSIHPIAPGRAAHLAARWFTTPDRATSWRASDGARALLDPGDRLTLETRSQRLTARSWGHGPLALLVHGWNGRGVQLAAIGRALAARGYRAVAFDHPGHGGSSGRTVTIPEMADAIRDVGAQLGGARVVVAHSLGAVAATLALSRGLPARTAVFLAPPVSPDQWLLRFGRAVGLPASAAPELIAAIEQRAGVAVQSVRPIDLGARLSTPLLVIHDRGDREVPFGDGEALVRAWPGARMLATDGLGHTRLLSSPLALDAIADFVGDAEVGDGAAPPARGATTWGVRDRHFAAIIDQLGAD
ncbi:MAG TPA: alpha/beta fold hydrolase [Kofleriaceae bacterium]|nr:alpha/beta fold hydrolase [Kofleriaceae bacterium]